MQFKVALPILLYSLSLNAQQITLGAGGDTIFHGQLQRQAYCMDQSRNYCHGSKKSPDFKVLWKYLEKPMKDVDLMFLNLEGPSTKRKAYRTNKETESSKIFNFDEEAIYQLAESGVDVMTLANNHSLDMGRAAISDTKNILSRANIQSTGTLDLNEDLEDGVAVVEKKGIRLAFIGCTHHLNGNKDTTNQVLKCFESASTKQKYKPNKKILNLIKKYSFKENVHGVIFTPHWGRDAGWVDRIRKTTAKDGRKIVSHQKQLAKLAIKNGAMTVLGHHPHVLQDVEYIQGKPVFYSLGNFLSNQTPWNWHNRDKSIKERHLKRVQRRVSVLLFLNIIKEGKQARVADYKVLPTYMKARKEFEAGAFPHDKRTRNLRTLIPVLEMDPFWDGKTNSIPSKTITSGSYKFQHHLYIARTLIEKVFPKEKWITNEEFQEPTRIFSK